jgi:AraC-like DNA-binding protein
MTYTVASEWVRFFLGVARQHGQDPDQWLRSRGHAPEELNAPRLPFELESQLFLDMQRRIPGFGLAAAEALRPGVFPHIDYAMLASANLDKALQRIIAFARVFNDGYEFIQRRTERGVELAMTRTAPGDVIIESRSVFVAASVVQMARRMWGSARTRGGEVVAVMFRFRRADDLGQLQDFFGDVIELSQPRDSVVFRDQALTKPNAAADENLARILDESNKVKLEVVSSSSPAVRVRAAIALALAYEVPTADEVAAAVGISTRTMNRQLAESGTSFKRLLLEIRMERAQAWLEHGESSSVVASLVYYSEAASFFRAYRRHFGKRPGDPVGAAE